MNSIEKTMVDQMLDWGTLDAQNPPSVWEQSGGPEIDFGDPVASCLTNIWAIWFRRNRFGMMCSQRVLRQSPKSAETTDPGTFALSAGTFLPPDWPVSLRENAPIDPLCGDCIKSWGRLATDNRQVRYRSEADTALNRVLSVGRGGRGKRTIGCCSAR